jgi:protein-S-isoprenylcysteine O-methyltransferase Ste14
MTPTYRTERVARPDQTRRKWELRAAAVLLGAILLFLQPAHAPHVERIIAHAGQALIVVAVAGRAWCTLYIGGRKFAELVTSGPYSLSRNPLYVFSFIGAVGAGLQSGSVVFALVLLAAVIVALHRTVMNEEEALGRKFGAAFEAYRQAVPRYGPGRHWRDETSVTVPLPLVYRTVRDGMLLFLMVPATMVVGWLQSAGLLPVLLVLP